MMGLEPEKLSFPCRDGDALAHALPQSPGPREAAGKQVAAPCKKLMTAQVVPLRWRPDPAMGGWRGIKNYPLLSLRAKREIHTSVKKGHVPTESFKGGASVGTLRGDI